MEDLKTIYELKELIERCFDECENAGHIKEIKVEERVEEEGEKPVVLNPRKVIINSDAIADHISKTIIGELMEFEILRKLSPMFRTFRSIEDQMKILDDKAAFQAQLPALRVGPK